MWHRGHYNEPLLLVGIYLEEEMDDGGGKVQVAEVMLDAWDFVVDGDRQSAANLGRLQAPFEEEGALIFKRG